MVPLDHPQVLRHVSAMLCPHCQGRVEGRVPLGHCASCQAPLLVCASCQAADSPFAKHCRACGQEQLPQSWPTPQLTRTDFRRPPRILEPQDEFSSRPLIAGGCLWLISSAGHLFRFSPFSTAEPQPILALGRDFGGLFPSGLGPWGRCPNRRLCVASKDALLTLDLARPVPRFGPRLQLPKGLECVPFERTVVPQLAVTNAEVFFLARSTSTDRSQSLALLRWPLDSSPPEQIAELPRYASGPFCAEDRILLATPEALLEWDGQQLLPTRWLEGFRPWTVVGEDGRLRPAHGHPMPVVAHDGVYFPGLFGTQQFGFLHQASGSRSLLWVRMQKKGVFYVNDSGSLLVAVPGALGQILLGRFSSLQEDDEIEGDGVPLAYGSLKAAFIKRTAGRALRFFLPGESQDLALNSLGSYTGLDWFLDLVWGTLCYIYGRANRRVGIAIWD
jgi:hypothetical protein